MKKLMTLIGAAVMAFGLYADDSTIAEENSIGFEIDEPGVTAVDTAFNFSETDLYEQLLWFTNGTSDVTATVKAYAAPFTAPTGCGSNYLDLETDNAIYRTVAAVSSTPATMTPVDITSTGRGGIEFDQWVKFSAYSEAPELEAGAKMAVWVKEIEAVEPATESTYKLMVTCAQLDAEVEPTATNVEVCALTDITNMHHLVVKAIDVITVGTDVAPGFMIELDGTSLTAGNDLLPASFNITASYTAEAAANKDKIFPSIIKYDATNAKALQGIAFKGSGAIDEIEIKEHPLYGYTLTATTPVNGTLTTSPASGSMVAPGATVTVTATANTGYSLEGITTNGFALAGTSFLMPPQAVTVAATFTANVYKITYTYSTGTVDSNSNPTEYTYGVGATIDSSKITKAGYNVTSVTPDTISTTDTGDKEIAVTLEASCPWTGSGTAADPYIINDAAGVAAMMTYAGAKTACFKVADSAAATITLTAAFNMHEFSGTFNGNGREIVFTAAEGTVGPSTDSDPTYAFFSLLSDGAVVSNVTFNGTVEGTKKLLAVVAAQADGTVQFENVTTKGTVTAAYNAAGFVSKVNGNASFNNCTNEATIVNSSATGNAKTGGFVCYAGAANATMAFTNCVNSGNVSSTGAMVTASGFVGMSDKAGVTVTFKDCVNEGDLSISSHNASGDKNAAGFIYFQGDNASSTLTIEDCVNTGDLSGNYTASGNTTFCLEGLAKLPATGTATIKGGVSTGTATVSGNAISTLKKASLFVKNNCANVTVQTGKGYSLTTAYAAVDYANADLTYGVTNAQGLVTSFATPAANGEYVILAPGAAPVVELAKDETITFNHNAVSDAVFTGITAAAGCTLNTTDVGGVYTATAAINTYTLTIPTVDNATAVVSNGEAQATAPYVFDYGTVVTVYWTANAGYQITAGATETITMNDNKTAANPTVAEIAVTSVTLSTYTATLDVGAKVTLIATVAPETALQKTVTWNSDSTAVATVDANGQVTAVAAGTANITATAGGVTSAACVITVNAASPIPVVPVNADATTVSNAIDQANFTDAGVKTMINGNAVVYNAFKVWAGKVAGGEAAVVESSYAAKSFQVSYIVASPTLFTAEPTLTVTEIKPDTTVTTSWDFKVKLTNGANGSTVNLAETVKDYVQVTDDLSKVWAAPAAEQISATVTDGIATVVVAPAENAKTYFMKVNVE